MRTKLNGRSLGHRAGAIRLVASGTTLIAALALAAALPQAAPAAFPGQNGLIAFASDRDRNYEIYAMRPDGTGQTRLTTNVAHDLLPAWSPDGQSIAFASDRDGNEEIYAMNADGTGQTRLTYDTAADHEPAWSPDRQRIAFASERDGNFEIYTMNADGTGQTRLTYDTTADYEPAWSPGGRKLAFVRFRDGHSDIYVMNADGTGDPTRLTTNLVGNFDPAWSPDGSKIAFAGKRDGNYEIHVMNADGSGQPTRLTTNLAGNFAPAWSPDGQRVAFVSKRDGNFEIYTMNADGTGQTRLTFSDALEAEPDWQPIVSRPPEPPAPPPETPAPAPGTAGALDTASPVVSRLAIDRRFAVSRKATARVVGAAAKRGPRKARRGTTIRYTLSEPATVTFAFERKRRGHRATSYRKNGTLNRAGSVGANSHPFSGRIGSRALRPGTYRLTVTATDAAGNRSKPRRRLFRVVRAGGRS